MSLEVTRVLRNDKFHSVWKQHVGTSIGKENPFKISAYTLVK